MNDRIKLAEAMGWTRIPGKINIAGDNINPPLWRDPSGNAPYPASALPNPYSDANDDYAVLEWMRGQDKDTFTNFAFRCNIHWMDDWTLLYQIGDYARAALKVLNEQESK